MVTDRPITIWMLFRIFFRTFFIQSIWNFERMQNVGFLYAISPALKRIHLDDQRRKDAFIRHLEFFNTHPYMASFIIGVTIAKEEQIAERGNSAQQILVLKKNMFGPFASLGDSIFWAGVRPLVGLVGSILVLSIGVWGVVVFLLLYNLVHILTRFLGLIGGYYYQEGIVERIRKFSVHRLIRAMNIAGVIISGLGIGVFFKVWSILDLPHYWIYILGSMAIVGFFFLAIRRGFSPAILFLIIVAVSLIQAPFLW